MSYPELIRRFASGNGAVFVGAGLSMAAGLPSWKKLVAPLRDTLNDLPSGEEFTPEQIAGWYEIEAGRPALVDHLRRELAHATPSPCHHVLASLPIDLFLTTNFDNLLEQSLADADVIVNDADFSALDDRTKKQLIKVHGDFRDGESIVFTKSDYDHYLENRPAIADMIRLTLMQRTVLFIGYSFNDRNLTTILSQVGKRLGEMQRPLFTLLLNPNTYAVRELERRYGVYVVPLTVEPGQDPSQVVHDWLDSFRTDIEREQVAYMARRAAVPVSNLPAHGNAFIGREKDIADVMKALGTSRIVGVQGFPGSGKTALAIEVARRCEYARKAELHPRDLLFAHCLYINARGTRAAEPLIHHILDKAADLFRLAAIKQLDISQLDRKKEQINAVLKIFRVLIIIDQLNGNIAEELSSWLETIPAPSSVLIVSRTHLKNVGMLLSIKELEESDAREFVRDRLEEHQIKLDDAQVSQLIAMVKGNPQGLKLLVGQIATGRSTSLGKTEDFKQYDASTVLDNSWDLLTENGKKILLAASIFATNAIPESALHAASGIVNHEDFLAGLKGCQNLLLLESCTEPKPVSQSVDGYSLHPMTITRARQILEADTEASSELYRRLGQYYLGWVRGLVVRPAPDVAYWNALATPNMLDIDDEWPTVRRLVYWMADHDHGAFVDMVFLLVHYLDTRLHNSDRLYFVKAAILILKEQGRVADEALLHIDALSWPLMEEGKMAEAEQEILHGLDVAEQLDASDRVELIALAHAWLSRIKCEQGEMEQAKGLIGQASSDLGALRAWISYRVHMVAGDIHVKRAEYTQAVNSYKECLRLVASYGGEEGYQILPRLGLTYCLVSGGLVDAQRIFSDLSSLSQLDNIEIGNLYAKYGLAVINFKSKRACSSGAANVIQQLRARVAQSTASSFMLWLMDEVYP